MTVATLMKLLSLADPREDVTVSDANQEDAYSVCYSHIMGVTINNNGSADILFNLNIRDEDAHEGEEDE